MIAAAAVSNDPIVEKCGNWSVHSRFVEGTRAKGSSFAILQREYPITGVILHSRAPVLLFLSSTKGTMLPNEQRRPPHMGIRSKRSYLRAVCCWRYSNAQKFGLGLSRATHAAISCAPRTQDATGTLS
jgi:hypothetical protein